MTATERYFAIAQWADGQPDEERLSVYAQIEDAVRDYDSLRNVYADSDEAVREAGEPRLFRLTPIDDADLWDWGVSSDAIPGHISEFGGERAARSCASGLPGGKIWRRRIGSETWEEVARG